MGNTTNLYAQTPVDETVATKVASYNALAQILDSAIAGLLTIFTTGGTTTLTGTVAAPQAQNMFLSVEGILTSNAIIQIPVSETSGRNRIYVIKNSTTGNYLLTVRAVGGTGIVIPRNTSVLVFLNDNDDIQRFSGPITGQRDVTTNNTALPIADITLPTLTGAAGTISYEILAKDATDVQVRRGLAAFSMVNKGAVYTSEIVVVSEAVSASTGTLTCTPTLVSGSNKVTLKLTPNTSLTATTHAIRFTITLDSEQAITLV